MLSQSSSLLSQSACSKERRTETGFGRNFADDVHGQSACSKERRTETNSSHIWPQRIISSERMF